MARDPEKRRASTRAHYDRHRDEIIPRNVQHALAWRRAYPDRWAAIKRAYGARKGAKSRGSRADMLERRAARLAEANAVQAWRWWLTVRAPDEWVRAYWEAAGAPWRNPRLTPAERWNLRYHGDPLFRALEIARTQRRKVRRRAMERAASDGTLSTEAVRELLEAATECAYCREPLTPDDRTLDHVVPITLGGPHSRANVVVCCRSCNARKGQRTEYAAGDAKPLSVNGSY
jgi:5-methylcytosine-specific restriction endonuclease McrA